MQIWYYRCTQNVGWLKFLYLRKLIAPMKHLLLFLLIGSSIAVQSQGLSLKEVFKIYTSDSTSTRRYLKANGWIFAQESIDKRNYELKVFILTNEKKGINDSLEILWAPAHKRGLMIVKYRSHSKTTYENIVKELEKMAATIKNTVRRKESTMHSYNVPGYNVFFYIDINNSSPFHFSLMIATPPKKMDSTL